MGYTARNRQLGRNCCVSSRPLWIAEVQDKRYVINQEYAKPIHQKKPKSIRTIHSGNNFDITLGRMTTPFQPLATTAQVYRDAIKLTRSELFGLFPDRQMPNHLPEDALVPFLGFAGPNYRRGGILLLAINPGGGTNSYCRRPPQDAELIPHILAFRDSPPSEVERCFDTMSSNYLKQAKTWNLWGIVQPVLTACKRKPEAFANIFPFRTNKDHKPHLVPLRNAINRVTRPLVTDLAPSIVVVLGKKAGDALKGYSLTSGEYFVVPRTNGDRYLSSEAKLVLEALCQHAA
jgi:hypothetical protein